MKRKLYNVSTPAPLRDEYMHLPDFYIGDSAEGLKTAAFLDNCSKAERIALFKRAAEAGTQDLAEAYVKVKKDSGMAEDSSEAEDLFEDEDYDTSGFVLPSGAKVENDTEEEDAGTEEE